MEKKVAKKARVKIAPSETVDGWEVHRAPVDIRRISQFWEFHSHDRWLYSRISERWVQHDTDQDKKAKKEAKLLEIEKAMQASPRFFFTVPNGKIYENMVVPLGWHKAYGVDEWLLKQFQLYQHFPCDCPKVVFFDANISPMVQKHFFGITEIRCFWDDWNSPQEARSSTKRKKSSSSSSS